jgi:hypothetical protein
MVQVIKKMKSTVSHKITAAKDAAANLAFRGRNLLSGALCPVRGNGAPDPDPAH